MEETEDGEEAIAETKYDFTQDVDALVSGEELSEEFRERAVTIFEAVVTSRVNDEVKALQEAFESTLTEEVEKIQTELAGEGRRLSLLCRRYMDEGKFPSDRARH